jgi:hypothetical protein
MPDHPRGREISVHVSWKLAQLATKQGDRAGAAAHADRACEAAEQLMTNEPSASRQDLFIHACQLAAFMSFAAGRDLTVARRKLEVACQAARKLHDKHPGSPSYLLTYLRTLSLMGGFCRFRDEARGRDAIETALRLVRQVPLSRWSDPRWAKVMSGVYLHAIGPDRAGPFLHHLKEAEAGLSDGLGRMSAKEALEFRVPLALIRMGLFLALMVNQRPSEALSLLGRHRQFIYECLRDGARTLFIAVSELRRAKAEDIHLLKGVLLFYLNMASQAENISPRWHRRAHTLARWLGQEWPPADKPVQPGDI